MSEEVIIGPGPACPYCGEVYGQHVHNCPALVQTKTPILQKMTECLEFMKRNGAGTQAIFQMEKAIIQQRLTEGFLEREIGGGETKT